MPLTPGTRLGPYEIVSKLGEGGMGEVYRARDTKLNRDVALKILPDVFAGDPDRLTRFTREAETLAALNHPNIAHVYDAGKPDAFSAHAFLVMELVDGEDLSEIIRRSALPVTDVLAIARQIADALECAHDSGIVHRDLKPANVKVREDGTVKVLDFGLAKALGPDAASSSAAQMNSPTLTARATQMGMIIGTAAYMAPEQARGRAVDRRADVWAFGVVLYEMLTGRRAFEGEDISITLASVLKEDVNWNALPVDLPTPVRRLLRRCLEKDPKKRLSSIGDARLELDEAASPSDRDGAMPSVAIAAAPAAVVPTWRRALPWAVAATGMVAAITTLVMWAPWQTTAAATPRKLLVKTGGDASLRSDLGAAAILSPDGTTLAFVAQYAGATRIFVRKLDQLQASPLAGTEDASNPFFSPTGESIGFFAAGKLKKIAVTGGAAIPLCDAPVGRGGTWTGGDDIIFTPNSTGNTVLMRVSASGGKPVPFGVLSQGATSQRWPQALPANAGILYSENATTGAWDTGNVMVTPAGGGGVGKVVVRGGYYGRFVPSGAAAPNRADRADGHLLYMQQGTLFAVRFNLDRLEAVGEARPAVEGVAASIANGGVQIGFSSDGTLVYVPGTTAGTTNPIDWMTSDGKVSALRSRAADWIQPRFSPDGQRLALAIHDGKQRDVWVYDWARDAMQQLTIDAGNDSNPIWMHDNRRIVFSSDREKSGTPNLYWANADGTGTVSRLTQSEHTQQAWSAHPNGKFIAFQETHAETGVDLMILPLEDDPSRGLTAGTATVFLSTPTAEVQPVFSPDGRWIAYFSTESGNVMDVHVRPFPGPGGHWRVTTDGGSFPRWSKTSNELLYVTQGRVMVVPYTVVGDSFRADKPRIWSPTNYVQLGNQGAYDVHPDGKRLAIIAAKEQSTVIQDQVVIVSNFFDYLWRIAPGLRKPRT